MDPSGIGMGEDLARTMLEPDDRVVTADPNGQNRYLKLVPSQQHR